MIQQSRWAALEMTCPEGRGESNLFLEWRTKNDKEALNSVFCDNPRLKDLSGSECQWTCWEKIIEEKALE